jgi:hypothetical protein
MEIEEIERIFANGFEKFPSKALSAFLKHSATAPQILQYHQWMDQNQTVVVLVRKHTLIYGPERSGVWATQHSVHSFD